MGLELWNLSFGQCPRWLCCMSLFGFPLDHLTLSVFCSYFLSFLPPHWALQNAFFPFVLFSLCLCPLFFFFFLHFKVIFTSILVYVLPKRGQNIFTSKFSVFLPFQIYFIVFQELPIPCRWTYQALFFCFLPSCPCLNGRVTEREKQTPIQNERESEREREIFHLLAYSPKWPQ